MTRLRKLFSIIIVANLSLLSCAYLDSPTETIISSQINPTSTIQITAQAQGSISTIEVEENTPTPYYSAHDFIAWTSEIKDCDPPCIWGINPGKTTVEEFYEILTPHGEIYKDELIDGEAKFTFFINERYSDNYLGYIEVPFITSDQIIEDFALRADLLWPNTDPTISYILDFWGEPSEIWVQIEIEPGIDWAVYDIRLVYADVPVLVSILNNAMEITETGYSLCPQRIQGDLAVGPLLLFSASLLSSDFGTTDGWVGFVPLTDINPQFDESSFTNIFQDSDTTTCIEIQE